MGMDAVAEIWVGVKEKHTDRVVEKLPKDMFDTEDSDDEYGPWYSPWEQEELDRIVGEYGCAPECIRCSDESAGFGITVFSHDWDYGAAKFDMVEIQRRVDEETAKLQALFDRFNIPQTIGVWIQTDWR